MTEQIDTAASPLRPVAAAALHLALHTPPLVAWLGAPVEPIPRRLNAGAVLATARTAATEYYGTPGPLRPGCIDAFCTAMVKYYRPFSRPMERSPADLLEVLLRALHEATCADAQNDVFFQSLFGVAPDDPTYVTHLPVTGSSLIKCIRDAPTARAPPVLLLHLQRTANSPNFVDYTVDATLGESQYVLCGVIAQQPEGTAGWRVFVEERGTWVDDHGVAVPHVDGIIVPGAEVLVYKRRPSSVPS